MECRLVGKKNFHLHNGECPQHFIKLHTKHSNLCNTAAICFSTVAQNTPGLQISGVLGVHMYSAYKYLISYKSLTLEMVNSS